MFPILQLRSDSPDVIEQLGSKPKFWFRREQDEQPWLARVREWKPEDFRGLVAKVPVEWMSDTAKQFCLQLLSVTVKRLKAIHL